MSTHGDIRRGDRPGMLQYVGRAARRGLTTHGQAESAGWFTLWFTLWFIYIYN